MKSIWGWPVKPLVVWAPIRTKRQQKEFRNFTENKDTVRSLLDNELIFGFPRLILDDFQKLERLWVACSIVTVPIPILIMSSCYGKIFTIVKKQNGRKLANTFTTGKHLRNRKAAITIGIIVCLFIITFIPSTVVYFMLLFEKDRCKELELNDVWLWVALVSFSHSAINPWVYGLRYRTLRKALREQVKIH